MNAPVSREHETEPRGSLRLGEVERAALRAQASGRSRLVTAAMTGASGIPEKAGR